MFFHFLSFSFIFFVGCSKSDFFGASISLRSLLTVLMLKNQFLGRRGVKKKPLALFSFFFECFFSVFSFFSSSIFLFFIFSLFDFSCFLMVLLFSCIFCFFCMFFDGFSFYFCIPRHVPRNSVPRLRFLLHSEQRASRYTRSSTTRAGR